MKHLETLEAYIPIDLLTINGFIQTMLIVGAMIIIRYLLFVAPFYFYFWSGKHHFKITRKLHNLKVEPSQIKHEIKWSLISTLIFAGSAYLMGIFWQSGMSQIYLSFDQYGFAYLFFSFFIYLIFHEFYFYFTHVWMHQPKIYKKVHHIHHLSQQVSPWASFSFHPYECIVHALFMPMMILLIPIHPIVIIGYFTFMTLTAISNHSGIELIKTNLITSWFISGAHHYKHHKYYNGNYGLYFTFIDKLFGTEIHSSQSTKARKSQTGELI